jgi:ubiquinone/menaquinone biosynthesis C-methylase UbiE
MDFDVKKQVKEHYGEIAKKVSKESKSSCCSSKCGCDDISNTSVIYQGENLQDLPKEAINASLGCANPLVFAEIKQGETVLDLGSGGGIDVLAASRYVGKTGKVYGLDMTDEMLALANQNKQKMGVTNVEFIKGYIESIPLADESVDVIMSNCVINLSEDKEKALKEAYRVLKKGGRFAVADIISIKEIPDAIRKHAEFWCGCLAGTLSKMDFANLLKQVGFQDISIEPVHIYSKEIIETEIVNRDLTQELSDTNIDFVDKAFAGAHIKARK